MIKCNVTVCGVIGRDASIRTNKEGKTFLVFPLRVMIPDTDGKTMPMEVDVSKDTAGKEVSMAFAETFKALSDPVRRRILELLKNGRLSAGEIGSHFDMTGATISYHLGILKKAGLVLESREKNFIYYELNTSVLEEIMLWISELKGGTSDVEKI